MYVCLIVYDIAVLRLRLYRVRVELSVVEAAKCVLHCEDQNTRHLREVCSETRAVQNDICTAVSG